ncbi:unnamed protein product [Heterobilharzia americana]|nr:unnamed protein product [Heterobilharzia americana]
MPSPKSKSPSPKKNGDKKLADDIPDEEDEILVPVPEGVMHRRMRFLLETKLKTDVEFIVGPKHAQSSIKAHKCMLAAESPVFDKLFVECDEWKVSLIRRNEEDSRKATGHGTEMELALQRPDSQTSKLSSGIKSTPGKKDSPERKSPDKELLRYIYYDEMVFTGVVGTIRTLYAARKYCFYDLARACVNYLENNVCIEHVLKLLQASFDFNQPRLRNLCMRLIINDTFEVLKRKEFKDVHKDIIVQILKQDALNIREIELFDQVMHWAENECERIGIPMTAMNQRIALGNHNFAYIRFPTILPHEFATHIVESGVLKADEIISILQYYITGRKPAVPYSCKTRRRPCLDLTPLDNTSVAFSEQTDVTFLVFTDNIRRAHSFRDLYIPEGVFSSPKYILIKQRQITGSPPPRFKLTDDEYAAVDANIKHLARLHHEREHFEYGKRHMAIMGSHYI